MAKAFATWSEVAPLNFKEVRTGGDIKIRFASRFHGDPWPFDGRGKCGIHHRTPLPQCNIRTIKLLNFASAKLNVKFTYDNTN